MNFLIVDDHPLFRDALKSVIRELDHKAECFEASDCANAYAAIVDHADFDLVLLDLFLPCQEGNGIDFIRRLCKEFPALPVTILSGSEEPADIQGALNEGALGYIPKSLETKVMLGALRLILEGGIYVPPHLVSPTPQPYQRGAALQQRSSPQLTPRQREIAQLLREGKSNKEIARVLGVSPETVKVHVAAIFRALDVNNRVLAVMELDRFDF